LAIPQSKWRFTTAGQIMVPLNRTLRVQPAMDLLTALETMDEQHVAHISVVDQESLVGILSRDQISKYLRLRRELGV